MGRLVPAVTRALDILELFLDGDGTLSAPDIIRRLAAAAHHRARAGDHARRPLTISSRSPASPDATGSACARTSSAAATPSSSTSPPRASRWPARVAETCDETVHVAILEGTDVIYIAKVDSTHAVRMVSAAGRRLPAHCTSVGKMLLASLPEPELDRPRPRGRRRWPR